MKTQILILGGGLIGELLAAQLAERYDDVVFVDEDERAVGRARDRGVDAHTVTLTEPATISAVVPDEPDLAVVAAPDDGVTLLLSQVLRVRFGADRVLAFVNDPQYHDAFAGVDARTVCVSAALSRAAMAAVDRDDPDSVSLGRSG